MGAGNPGFGSPCNPESVTPSLFEPAGLVAQSGQACIRARLPPVRRPPVDWIRHVSTEVADTMLIAVLLGHIEEPGRRIE
jgi:hypothetical protein